MRRRGAGLLPCRQLLGSGLLLPVPFTLASVLIVLAFWSSYGCLRWQLLPAFPTLLSASTRVWEASWFPIDLLVCSNI